MTNYIKNPNLPQSRVATAIISDTDKRIIEFLESFEIKLLFTQRNKSIDPAISTHADINAFHCGNKTLILDKSQPELFKSLSDLGFEPKYTEAPVSGEYPNDCKLNCACIGNRIFGKLSALDKTVLDLEEFEKINVNQGYSKCSTCIVGESAVITDDVSIQKACQKENIDVLLIEKGDVLLSGHEYGFIGGASTLISKNHIAFFGDIEKHKNFKQIEAFLKFHGCGYSYIKNYPLTDIGGIIPLLERTRNR